MEDRLLIKISPPHPAHAGADVDTRAGARSTRRTGYRNRPYRLFEQAEQAIRNEPCPCGIDVAVASRMLAVGEETLRHHEMQIVFRARHGDIKQPAFPLGLPRSAR